MWRPILHSTIIFVVAGTRPTIEDESLDISDSQHLDIRAPTQRHHIDSASIIEKGKLLNTNHLKQEKQHLLQAQHHHQEQAHRHRRHQDDPKEAKKAANDTKADTPDAKEKEEEDKLQEKESGTFSKGLGSMASAFTDPRGFLLQQPGMKEFMAGLKKAIDLENDGGKCLKSGQFANFGCIDADSTPPICKCRSIVDYCYGQLTTDVDEKDVVERYTKGDVEGAFGETKFLILGECRLCPFKIAILGVVCLIMLLIIFFALKATVFKRKSLD
jgi:hypothetical protein